jgi:negative regulator of flagellin synthesis FlgM
MGLSAFRQVSKAKGHDMVDPTSFGPVKPVSRPAVEPSQKTVPSRVTSGAIAQASSLPQLIELASELASQEVPIDYAKIALVRQAVALGTYRIEPEKVADAMFGFSGKAQL